MQCEHCKATKAVIHFTQIVNNEQITFHLCEPCAKVRGLKNTENFSSFPVGEFLSEVGANVFKGTDGKTASSKECSFCGATYDNFQRSGKIGCAQCYFTFEEEVGILLRRIQGSQQHVGISSQVARKPVPTNEQKKVRELKKELEACVRKEEYERAAKLRDEIKSLELSLRS